MEMLIVISYLLALILGLGSSLFLLKLVSLEKISILQFVFLIPPVWVPTIFVAFPKALDDLSFSLGVGPRILLLIGFYGFYNLIFSLIILINLNKLNRNFRQLVVETAIFKKEKM
jgi:hypothetical protein